MKDEWYIFFSNFCNKVNVFIFFDESIYMVDNGLKMGGDYFFIWYYYYDGGRFFFILLGYVEYIYKDVNFQKMIEVGIKWVGKCFVEFRVFFDYGLLLDFDVDYGVKVVEGDWVVCWINQVLGLRVKDFEFYDYGF